MNICDAPYFAPAFEPVEKSADSMSIPVRSLRSYITSTHIAYALALALPFLNAFLSQRIPFFRAIPYSLGFVTIVLVATLGGMYPALLTLVVAVIARLIFPVAGLGYLPIDRTESLRALFLISAGIIMSAIAASRRKSELRLKQALRSVQERNDALLESIAERKLAEAAVLRSEKLAAMGRLASTIAHEINNPLEAVTNLIYLTRGETASNETAQTYLDVAEKELARLGHITRLTLGFARNTAVQSNVDMVAAVEDILFIFQHRLHNKSVCIDRNFQPGVAVTIAPHELRQVITNLLSNAVDATGVTGSSIGITIRSQDGNAYLIVEDNGDGIPTANLQRIFDPFFSTKEEVGTGIGLWVTREIVMKCNGTIVAESGDLSGGVSTRFTVELPLAVRPSTN
jgi:signal transduction histidine kinase